ncbi:YbjQ family protein [uncultured Ferrimonas sp.]|uniref:YbjQ family protein n=1 Tax=uncultured Ferrimonas sp. TaxID=432640 RepID=UPI002625BEF7|nr:YbjQ family protein [uncultured Ferrimonas sp.]
MASLATVVVLLLLGFVFGRRAEARHFKRLRQEETRLQSMLIFNTKVIPPQFQPCQVALVGGNAVIAVDYFKTLIATLRNIVGGNVTSYESLLERARRQSIVRMKQEAERQGARAVFNLRLETSAIGQGEGGNNVSVEIYAYGTAVIPDE